MDINPQSVKPISDDPELAKVLAGVSQQTDEPSDFDASPFIQTPAVSTPTDQAAGTTSDDSAASDDTSNKTEATSEPDETNPYETAPLPEPTTTSQLPTPDSNNNDLSSIKKDALNDLRPLVDKLDIAPEEKFDTYLLLIRSTDDKDLIEPAYVAAQAITDESRKAQALLDVIKEIDYLSNPTKA